MTQVSAGDYSIKVWPTDTSVSSETAKGYAETDSATARFQINDLDGAYKSDRNSQYLIGFRKYWFRFEFNEPVTGFYVDWDDGEDNSIERSNSQFVKLDSPQFYGAVSHVFTKSGKFFPMVRGVSIDGFWSKYYTHHGDGNDFSSLEDNTLTSGQNEFSVVSTDYTTGTRYPYLSLTTLPPVGILKVDRKTVFSGINNEIVQTTLDRRGGPAVVYAWFSGDGDGTSMVNAEKKVTVIYETVDGFVKTQELHTKHSAITAAAPVALGDVWKILEVKLSKIKEATSLDDTTSQLLHPKERIYLRWCAQSIHQDSTDDKITEEIAATASVSAHWVKSTGIGALVANSDKVLIVGTANFDGSKTATTTFDVDSLSQGGGACRVTTADPHGMPVGEDVTMADCGLLNGTFEITTVSDSTHFDFATAITGVSAGGSATARMVNAVRFPATLGSLGSSEGNTGYWGVIVSGEDACICNVSTGWPYLKLHERGFFVTADMSESRTRAPNLSIPETSGNLLLDDGNGDWAEQAGGTHAADTLGYATDTLDYLYTNPDTSATAYINRLTGYRKRLEYTHDPFKTTNTWTGPKDYTDNRATGGTFRFVDSFRLLRCQVKDNRTETAVDKFAYSQIESFTDYSSETAANNAVPFPSEVANRNAVFQAVNIIPGTSGSFADLSTSNKSATTTLTAFTENASIDGIPKNYILVVNSERKFDRVFCGMLNTFADGIDAYKGGKCRLSVMYPAYDSRRDETKFRAIPFQDFTNTPKDDTSLYVNGPLVFDAPDDWKKCKYDTVTWPIAINDTGATYDYRPTGWSWDGYAILISVICKDESSSTAPLMSYIMPYDNDHSEVVKVQDAMHVSLNDVVIAQSLSFKREGKYIRIDDRIGRSELRKIGSAGGSVRFGGISFGDYSTAAATGYDSYEIVKQHQQEGTPVYLDLQRPNGEYVRFFGRITDLAEDVPTGKVSNKWAVTMQTEAVAEFDNDGDWLSETMISLGGVLEDEPKYLQ